MNNWFLFFLATLACFRLTRLVTDDKITESFRRFVVRTAPQPAKTKAKQGISCPYCVSFYFATALTLYACLSLAVIDWRLALLWQPAVWGGSVLLNQVFVVLAGE